MGDGVIVVRSPRPASWTAVGCPQGHPEDRLVGYNRVGVRGFAPGLHEANLPRPAVSVPPRFP